MLRCSLNSRKHNLKQTISACQSPPDGYQHRPRGGTVACGKHGNGITTQRFASCASAVVEGVRVIEDDPNDMSVGYGGLPNEDGVVQLDASVMDGASHKAGAVAALERVQNPAAVALKVLRETDHVMLVGKGALQFARAHGFPEKESLLTEKSHRAWLRWKRNLNPNDDWLDDDQILPEHKEDKQAAAHEPIPYTWGTIHCAAVDENGDVGACTSTSGLSYKIPGRVGDSPIIGAGMFVSNEVGAAGATGRGESVIQSCGAFQVVRNMADGDSPEDACLKVLKWIADHTRRSDLLDENGRPNFEVMLYALRKDGTFGGATMLQPRPMFIHDGVDSRAVRCPSLF